MLEEEARKALVCPRDTTIPEALCMPWAPASLGTAPASAQVSETFCLGDLCL